MTQGQYITRALLSVSDKSGLIPFAQKLYTLGVELFSTGGTANLLRQANIPVTEISQYTQFPEMMAGRVKTLHPKIFAGILRRGQQDDALLEQHQIKPFDLIIVNLYPFAEVTANEQCELATAIENIDIGGPSMIRAAAKNYDQVAVVVDPQDYSRLMTELENNQGQLSRETRFQLAKKAFTHTANYDANISNYLNCMENEQEKSLFPSSYTVQFHKQQALRYGENPQQQACFYREANLSEGCISNAKQLQGKELSFNNIADSDAAYATVASLGDKPACVIVKHANPCGVAIADNLTQAYQRAFACDPTSAFGGIIAFNQPLDEITAQIIMDNQFVEVIIATGISKKAQQILSTKKNVRILLIDATGPAKAQIDYKRVQGGLLVQDSDSKELLLSQLQIVTQQQPSAQQMADLLFAWKVVKYVKSNAIVYAKDQATIGIGAGQMSRIDSARIASEKAIQAHFDLHDAVMASDAFFPFRDSIDTAAKAGIKAIIQPGGSIRDEEVIAAADEAGIAMIFTGVRHFRH